MNLNISKPHLIRPIWIKALHTGGNRRLSGGKERQIQVAQKENKQKAKYPVKISNEEISKTASQLIHYLRSLFGGREAVLENEKDFARWD